LTSSEAQKQYFTCLLNPTELQILRKAYKFNKLNSNLTFHTKKGLAEVTGLSADAVTVWFQHERYKDRMAVRNKLKQEREKLCQFEQIGRNLIDITR